MSDTTQNATTGMNALEAAASAALKEQKPIEAATTQGDPADKPLGENGEKALKAEREARAAAEKQAAEFKAKLDKIEAATLTDLERAQKEAEAAKAEVEKVPQKVAEQLRGYLAGIHEISDEDAELYLTSNDPAVLLKQAAGIAARRTQTANPKPDLTQGTQQATPLNGDGLSDALARAVGAR